MNSEKRGSLDLIRPTNATKTNKEVEAKPQ